VKILDFGLAKQTVVREANETSSPTLAKGTEPGVVMGTVGYMAPEQVKGLAADHRADIFAFGCVLYEMATGRRAFAKDTNAETMTAILKEEPPELASDSGALPSGLRTLLRHALEKSPGERIQSARDLVLFLQTIGTTSTGASAVPAVRSRLPRGVAAALLALAAGYALGRLGARPRAASLAAVRPLTFSGSDGSPAVSPDGKSIAFSSSRDGKQRIWLKNLAGGGEAVFSAGSDDLPRFSPDGSQLLFIRIENGLPALYRQELVGGEARRVVDDAVFADFLPDGRTIIFLRYLKDPKIGLQTSFTLIGPDGGGAREIARADMGLTHPRVSPDGRTIVTSKLVQGGSKGSFYVVGTDGKNGREIPSGGIGSLSATAFVSNDEIVFSRAASASGSITGSEARLFRMRLGTGSAVPVLLLPINSRSIDILGPGRVVLDTASPRENLREFTLAPGDVGPRWITHGSSNDRQPRYDRDGDWVIFSSNRSGNLDLWEISTKTGATRRITDDAAEDWDPGFTADGTKILWSSNRSGPFEIWMCEKDGSGARQVSHDGQDAENPTETPDGWVVYSSGHPEKRGIWKVRNDGSEATQLVKGAFTRQPELSPGGKWLAYVNANTGNRNTLTVIRVSDGASAGFTIDAGGFPASTLTVTGVLGRSRWLRGGKVIAYVGQDESGVNGIYAQDFEPGKDTSATRRRLAAFDREMTTETFGISPDESRLTVASYDKVFSVMLAENVDGVTRPERGR
jgi:Tol biopolymer transport system component